MPFDVLAVANDLLDKADADGRPLDHQKLQKLVMIAHGWHLAITGEPLFYDRVEAWPYGPTIPALYREFRSWGSRPITGRAMTVDFDTWDETPYSLAGAGDRTRDILDRVWRGYGSGDALQLATLTQDPGSPWDQVAKMAGSPAPRGVVIANDIFRNYYTRAALESRPQHAQ